MSGNKLKSAAPAERERLLPPTLVLTFTAIVGIGLALMFPRETLRERLLGQGRTIDGLTMAYLEAWWKVTPDDPAFMGVLAEQYARTGRLEEAQAMLERMQAVQGTDLSGQVLRTRIEIAQQRAWAALPGTPEREQNLVQLRSLLDRAAGRRWPLADLQALATQARQAGADEAMRRFYTALASQDRNNAAFWNRQLADLAIAGGDYRDAANALFAQQAAATTLAERRALFLKAVQTLQSGNLLDEALAQAERHGGKLLDDPEVLRYLTRLALAANKPEQASRYVERLLKVSARLRDGADAERAALAARQAEVRRIAASQPWSDRGVVFLDGPRGLALREALAASGQLGVRKAAAQEAAPAQPADTKFNVEDYELAYRVFLSAGKLDQAQRVAETAVRRLPGEPVWRERLAQVAEWNRQPAVALKSWLDYARATNDERAWDAVMRLAPGLSDDRAYLAALRHRAGGADLKTVDEVVAAYERLGEPEEAMRFLEGLSHGPKARDIMERHAALAERAGKDERAFQLYTQLQQRFGPRPAYALKLANLLYVRGKLAHALDAMLPARAAAGPRDLLYWRTFTELARLNQRDDLLQDGYRQLMVAAVQSRDEHCMQRPAGPARNDCMDELRDAQGADFSNLIAYYDKTPIDAGRIAEADWRRGASPASLELALYYYTRAHAYRRIERLLQDMSPEQRRVAKQSSRFLMRRAEYYRVTGQRDQALADLRHAAGLPDADSETLAALLWTLVDQGSDTEVRAVMRRLQDQAEDNPDLWGAFAAGHMRYYDGRAALHYLRKLKDGQSADPLWLNLLADAYEAIGQTDMAWRVRRQAWIDLHRGWARRGAGAARMRPDNTDGDEEHENASGAPSRADLRRQTVALGQIFASGDVSRALVIQMLRADRASTAARDLPSAGAGAPSQLGEIDGLPPLREPVSAEVVRDAARREAALSAAGRDAALAWAMSAESSELARGWLARRYASRLQRPAYAEVAIALDRQDLNSLDRILERQAGRVPVANQIEANQRLDRLGAAQTLAFETQERARSDDALQETLRETLLFNAQAIEPRVRFMHQKPLEFTEGSLAGGVRLWDGYDLNLQGTWRDQRSTDPEQLVNVPASDRRADLSLGYRDNNRRWRATAGYREGLDTMATARFFGEWNQQGRLQFSTLAGLNQPADESAPLRVGGAKDVLALGATWRFSLREFIGARIEYSRFRGQDRSTLGHGMVYDVEAGYKIRTAYPDYTVRVVATHASYSTQDGSLTPRLAALVPAGDAATPAFYMPQGFTQAGVLFGFGTELLDEYTRKWRPFGEVGLLHDTRARQNFRVQGGVAGSVLGNDHLALYVSHETAARNGGRPMTELGLRYRWLY
ncbi:tetratricopeptide repeat protein [Cupriavidus necator]|uniref:tetratricopeptide repeat protein n=1 Tax=Cupriavidus necator TaxID=106590 RepID=UPI00149067AD|nr:tetratricopeptide repeat protein [Cupriavidus necator]NOV24683.1 tetratricopeptide repeat protein [Cupriavidus necator]